MRAVVRGARRAALSVRRARGLESIDTVDLDQLPRISLNSLANVPGAVREVRPPAAAPCARGALPLPHCAAPIPCVGAVCGCDRPVCGGFWRVPMRARAAGAGRRRGGRWRLGRGMRRRGLRSRCVGSCATTRSRRVRLPQKIRVGRGRSGRRGKTAGARSRGPVAPAQGRRAVCRRPGAQGDGAARSVASVLVPGWPDAGVAAAAEAGEAQQVRRRPASAAPAQPHRRAAAASGTDMCRSTWTDFRR